jgi:hypothetical protein
MPAAIPARPDDTARDAGRVQVALIRQASVAPASSYGVWAVGHRHLECATCAGTRTPPVARERDLRFVELHYGVGLATELRAGLERRDARRQSPP